MGLMEAFSVIRDVPNRHTDRTKALASSRADINTADDQTGDSEA